MGKAKHTPTPWRLSRYIGHEPKEDWPGRIIGNNGQDVFAGPFSFRALTGKTAKEAEANAEFIVRAVNCHEELLAACRAAVSAFAQADEESRPRAENWAALRAASDTARAAIARAESESP